jgi:hypothetical protein
MGYTDRCDGDNPNRFEGTPAGGSPHWFARGSQNHAIRHAALWGAGVAAFNSLWAYRQTGDKGAAVRAAGASGLYYLALMPFCLAWGFASFFCLGALIGGTFAFAAIMALVAFVGMFGFLFVPWHFTRRLGGCRSADRAPVCSMTHWPSRSRSGRQFHPGEVVVSGKRQAPRPSGRGSMSVVSGQHERNSVTGGWWRDRGLS